MAASTTKRKAGKKKKKAKKETPVFTARTADKHVLYQKSVQAPEDDSKTFARWFKKYAGRELRSLREDFCGTAVLACHHVRNHPDNTAIGVDLHRPTLDWGIEHNVNVLLDDAQKKRLKLIEKDVLKVTSPKVDCALALNFSYQVFTTRKQLGSYIKAVFKGLKPGGVFYMDALGGPDVMQANTDITAHDGFDYHWEQRTYDPISHRLLCAIHFEFPDGTQLKDAFVYDWRLWTLAEIQELFAEAGFEDTHVMWEGTDQKTMTGNGVFRRRAVGDMDEAWISIVVGKKPE
ncbi:MAG: class I SAM-dependent methyltransferase [Planctomycetota bacterium]